MDIKAIFAGIDEKELDAAFTAATKKVKPPKADKFQVTGPGAFNAIGLPVVPHAVASVTDASKSKLTFRVIGQQVIASRRLVAPVAVEYITDAEHDKWHAAIVAAVRAEVEK